MISINITETIIGLLNLIIGIGKFILGKICLIFRQNVTTGYYNGYKWVWKWELNKDFKFEATDIKQVCNNEHEEIAMIEYTEYRYRECPRCKFRVNDYEGVNSAIAAFDINSNMYKESTMIPIINIKTQIENDFIK